MLGKEELKGTYLKYSEDITEEMFNKIIEIIKGYFGETNRNMPTDYNSFRALYGFIQIFGSNYGYNWSLDNNEQGNKEIQISDILEEDYQNVMDIEVGDTVKCISENKSKFGRYGGSGWEKDLEFIVTGIGVYGNYKVYFGGKSEQGVYSDAVRLVKRGKHKMKKYVNVTNEEQWDFVASKLTNFAGDKVHVTDWKTTCIKLDGIGWSSNKEYNNNNYYTFQEWLDLNNYTFPEIPNLIKGKWYKLSNGTSTVVPGWYIRFECISDNTVRSSEHIDNTGRFDILGRFGTPGTYTLTLLEDLTEIQQFLPEGHKDKIKPEEEFQVGDWVYCLNDNKLYELKSLNAVNNVKKAISIKYRKATSEEIQAITNPQKEELIKFNLPTDEELLAYANEHFIPGTKFISHITDEGIERECIYGVNWRGVKRTSFGWRVVDRKVYCGEGMDISEGIGCSNPYIYTDEGGWCKITYDASLIKPKESDRNWYVKVNSPEYVEVNSLEEALGSKELVNSNGVKFIVGNKYINSGEVCYYCGINSNGIPIFELINYTAVNLTTPENWVSKGNNTYWGYEGIEEQFSEYIEPTIETPRSCSSLKEGAISSTKKQYDLSTTITRAVKEDNPNLIFEEYGLSEITGLKNRGCIKSNSNIPFGGCADLDCCVDSCPFNSTEKNNNVDSVKAWLYRDRKCNGQIPYKNNDDSVMATAYTVYATGEKGLVNNDFANPIIIKSKKQKKNKLIIVNN